MEAGGGDTALKRAPSWRAEVEVRMCTVRQQLAHAEAAAAERTDVPADTTTRFDAVREKLACAHEATRIPSPFERLRSWWTGERIDAAWESVLGAEAALVEVATEPDLLAMLPRLRAWMRLVLVDARRLAYEKAFDDFVRARSPDRTVIRQAYEETMAANREWHANLRTFRNLLFAVAGGLLLMLVGVGLWHALNPDFAEVCGRADGTAATSVCVAPTHGAVFAIALVGSLGGLLSSAFLLGKMHEAPSRYNVLAPQIVLKAVAGAATALVGLLLLVSDVVVAPPSGLDTTAGLIAYAALFGFSQQLLTQLVDRRAGDLIDASHG